MDKPLWGLRVQAPFGARVLSFVCCAPNDGFGPQSGLVQRVVLYAAAWGSENRPTGLRPEGRRLAVRTAMEHPIGALPRTPFPASRDFAPVGSMSLDSRVAGLPYESSSFATSRGNEKIGGTGYCVTYDTESQSRNAPCVPFRGRGPQSGEGVDGGNPDYDTRCGCDRRRRPVSFGLLVLGHACGMRVDGPLARGLWPPDGGRLCSLALRGQRPFGPRVADCRSAAMLIKSALRDWLYGSYSMIPG